MPRPKPFTQKDIDLRAQAAEAPEPSLFDEAVLTLRVRADARRRCAIEIAEIIRLYRLETLAEAQETPGRKAYACRLAARGGKGSRICRGGLSRRPRAKPVRRASGSSKCASFTRRARIKAGKSRGRSSTSCSAYKGSRGNIAPISRGADVMGRNKSPISFGRFYRRPK